VDFIRATIAFKEFSYGNILERISEARVIIRD